MRQKELFLIRLGLLTWNYLEGYSEGKRSLLSLLDYPAFSFRCRRIFLNFFEVHIGHYNCWKAFYAVHKWFLKFLPDLIWKRYKQGNCQKRELIACRKEIWWKCVSKSVSLFSGTKVQFIRFRLNIYFCFLEKYCVKLWHVGLWNVKCCL